MQVPDVHNPQSECGEQKQRNEGVTRLEGQPEDVPSASASVTYAGGNEEMLISSIRATDVAFHLGRIPAGFYTVVKHSGREWKTGIKSVSVDDDMVEWGVLIPVPSDLSAIICLGIYAPFEFQPVLGDGELLRKLMITVEQLLNCSEKAVPFTFTDNNGVVSPCSSLSVTVRRQNHEGGEMPASDVVKPPSSTELRGQLETATNEGHSALSRYRKRGEKRDLECSIEQFEHALNICPPYHPCRAAAQSNLAMAKLTFCQVSDTNISFDVPLNLYCGALSARPIGHLDRPSTLIQLAVVHLAQFKMGQDEVDATQADGLLHEAMDLSSAGSHEEQAAASMLRQHTRREISPVEVGGKSSVEQNSASQLTDDDPQSLGDKLLWRFSWLGNLDDLQQGISLLEASFSSTSVRNGRYFGGLANLGTALLGRFYHFGELSDIEQTILSHGDVLDLTPDDHPVKPTYLNNLGEAFTYISFPTHWGAE